MSQWQTQTARNWRNALYPGREEPPLERAVSTGRPGRGHGGTASATVLLRALDKQLYPCEPQPRLVVRHRAFDGTVPREDRAHDKGRDMRTPNNASACDWLVDPLHLEGTYRESEPPYPAAYEEYRSGIVR